MQAVREQQNVQPLEQAGSAGRTSEAGAHD